MPLTATNPEILSPVPKLAAINPLHAPLSLQKSTGFLFEQTLSNPNPLFVQMAFNGKSRSITGTVSALEVRRSSAATSAIPAFGPVLPGTGFETLPPLAVLFKPFQFLKSLCLKSVGLGLDSIPFSYGLGIG